MEVTVQIPDELASRMGVSADDLSRRALEALALEAEWTSQRAATPSCSRASAKDRSPQRRHSQSPPRPLQGLEAGVYSRPSRGRRAGDRV